MTKGGRGLFLQVCTVRVVFRRLGLQVGGGGGSEGWKILACQRIVIWGGGDLLFQEREVLSCDEMVICDGGHCGLGWFVVCGLFRASVQQMGFLWWSFSLWV